MNVQKDISQGSVGQVETLNGLMRLLNEAGAATLSFAASPKGTVVSPLLDQWCMDSNGELAHFCWGKGTEDDEAYDVVLTRDGLAAGWWTEDGFVCKDNSGRTVCMKLFRLEQYAAEDVPCLN